MKQHFFITGLPRSRTAWLANWLTYGDSFCYHDELARASSVDAFFDKLRKTPAQVVGYADPTLSISWRAFDKEFPNAKWIIMWRDSAAVLKSAAKAFGISEAQTKAGLKIWLEGLMWLQAERSERVLNIPYDKLSDCALSISRWLGVDSGGAARLALLKDMQVQVHPDYLASKLNHLREAA